MVAHPEFAYDWTTTPLANSPGTIVSPESIIRMPDTTGAEVTLRPHLGTMGVAPVAAGRHFCVPSGMHEETSTTGEQVPARLCTAPLAVLGALLSLGDPHLSQGDGQITGTALKASLDAILQISVRWDLPFDVAVLKTQTHWYVHGFGDNLDETMRDEARAMLRLLRNMWELRAHREFDRAIV